MGWGGKQSDMRDSVVTAELLGPHKHDGMLAVGDAQRMQFEETGLPPWYDPDVPQWDGEPKLRGRGLHGSEGDWPLNKQIPLERILLAVSAKLQA